MNTVSKQDETIITMYRTGQYDIENLAKEFNRSFASIWKMLVANRVFSSKSPTAQNKARTTKANLVTRLSKLTNIEREKLATLEKANHEALELIFDVIAKRN